MNKEERRNDVPELVVKWENFPRQQQFNKHNQKFTKPSYGCWCLNSGKHNWIVDHFQKPVSYKELMTTLNEAELVYQPAQGGFPYSHSCRNIL